MPGRAFTALLNHAQQQYGYLTPDDARELDIDPTPAAIDGGAPHAGAPQPRPVQDADGAGHTAGRLYGGGLVDWPAGRTQP